MTVREPIVGGSLPVRKVPTERLAVRPEIGNGLRIYAEEFANKQHAIRVQDRTTHGEPA